MEIDENQRVVDRRQIIVVDEAGKSFSPALELDNDVEDVLGIAVSSDQPKLLLFRGFFDNFKISDREILDDTEGYEAKMLMTGIDVAPDLRFKTIMPRAKAGNRNLNIRYQDRDHPNAAFTPYEVNIYFRVTLKE